LAQIILFQLELAKCEGTSLIKVGELEILLNKNHKTNLRPHAENSLLEYHRTQAMPTMNTTETKTTAYYPLVPRKMTSTTNPIYFMHIGKTGGTSLGGLLNKMNTLKRFKGKYYFKSGQNHFDWSFIQKHRLKTTGTSTVNEEFDVSNNTDVITFLRHPVSRAVSQFYYSQQISGSWRWVKELSKDGHAPLWTLQSINQYINDPNKTFVMPLHDGEGGVNYLAGIWKKTGWLSTSEESNRKVYLRKNRTAAILRAAKRLDSTTWFGLLEEIERSMKLLQLTLDLAEPPKFQTQNAHRKTKRDERPSNQTKKNIEKYIPQDMWLYEYAKRLLKARWDYFTGNDGGYVHPDLPPLPDFS